MNLSKLPEYKPSRASRWLSWLAVIGLIVGLTAIYEAIIVGESGTVVSTDVNGHAMVILNRERSGHFLARGEINNHTVTFIVDTGATDVAISENAARSMGLEFGPRIRVMTAAGPASAWVTRLDSVRLGGLELMNVRATITSGLGDEALLGMGFLKHFNLRQDGDRLVIESKDAGVIGAEAG